MLRLDQIKALKVDWEDVGRQLEDQGAWLHRTFEGGGEEAGAKASWLLWLGLVGFVVVIVALGQRSKEAGR